MTEADIDCLLKVGSPNADASGGMLGQRWDTCLRKRLAREGPSIRSRQMTFLDPNA